jgi:hypothetical protein
MTLKFLNLPQLPPELSQALTTICNNVQTRNTVTPWLKDFHAPVPVASQEYGNARTQIPVEIMQKILLFYKSYLQEDFLPILAVTDNILGTPSCTPPHCDKYRKTAINYLLSLGGNSVTTSFYKQTRQSSSLDLAEHLCYRDVDVETQHVLPLQQWHAFDVQTFHSVENITDRRCILSLVLKSNPDFVQFVKQYQHLIMAE